MGGFAGEKKNKEILNYKRNKKKRDVVGKKENAKSMDEKDWIEHRPRSLHRKRGMLLVFPLTAQGLGLRHELFLTV